MSQALLRALIAERLGWTNIEPDAKEKSDFGKSKQVGFGVPPRSRERLPLPKWDSDISEAWTLIEIMSKKDDEESSQFFFNLGRTHPSILTMARDEAAKAICLAFLGLTK